MCLHIYPESHLKLLKIQRSFKLKKKELSTSPVVKSTVLLFEIWVHATQKSLLTSSRAQAFSTFSYRSFSYFFPNKILLLMVPGNSQGCWGTYAILPRTVTCPWLGGSSPSTALNSDDWNRCKHTCEQAAPRREQAPQHSFPALGAW